MREHPEYIISHILMKILSLPENTALMPNLSAILFCIIYMSYFLEDPLVTDKNKAASHL